MKNIFFLFLFKILSIDYCLGQSTFEILMPGGVDTSLRFGGIIENPNGGYILRSTAQKFNPLSVFEGSDYQGTTIQWLDDEGNMINWSNYETNGGCLIHDEFSNFLALTDEGNILVPYSKNNCYVSCGTSGTDSYNLKKALMKISHQTGELMENKIFIPFCSESDDIIGIKQLTSGGYIVAYMDWGAWPSQLVIEELDSNFEETEVIEINDNLSDPIFDTINNVVIGIRGNTLKWYNLEGSLVASIPTGSDSASYKSITTRLGFIYAHVAVTSGVSHLLTFDLTGELISDIAFDDLYKFKDIMFINEGSLLTIEDLSQGVNDSIQQPVRVRLFNSSLQLIAKKEYGFPFVHPERFKSTSDGNFIVLGTKIGDFKTTNRFADRQYILKQSIYNLLQTSTNEAHLTKDFSVTISPNPTIGKSSYFISNASAGNISYELFDAQGNIVQTAQAIPYQGEIDLTMYPPGMYIILMKDQCSGKTDVQKVIKL